MNWSDALGNSATALEIVRDGHRQGATSDDGLCVWIVERVADLGRDLDEYEADDVCHDLLYDAAQERVRTSAALADFEDIVFDSGWASDDGHLWWAATAPEKEVADWAETIAAAQESE